MSKGNVYENELLEHVLNNAALPLIGDAAGLLASAVAGDLYVAFHTADPGEAGDQTTNEAAYTGYARAAITRGGGGWNVTGNSASPAADVQGSECTAVPGSALTHFSIGTALTGTGKILYKGTLTPNITMAVGVTPVLKDTTDITED